MYLQNTLNGHSFCRDELTGGCFHKSIGDVPRKDGAHLKVNSSHKRKLPELEVTASKSMPAFDRIKAHMRIAFCPQVELERETALALFNNDFLFRQIWM